MSLLRARMIATAVAVHLILTGCSWGPLVVDQPPDRTPAELIAARCPRSASELGLTSVDTGPTPGAVPADFGPATVLQCRENGETTTPSADGTNGTRLLTIVEETAPVTPALLSALSRPDQAFAPGAQGACPAVGWVRPFLLLVDDHQRAVRPRLPTDPCQLPRPELDRALSALTFTPVRTYTVEAG